MREFGQFFNPDTGVLQHFDHRPGPEPAVFFEADVATFPARWVFGPDPGGRRSLHHTAAQAQPAYGEQPARLGGFGRVQDRGGLGSFGFDPGGERGQYWQPFPGPLIHAGLALRAVLLV